MCDEINVMITAASDGNADTPARFFIKGNIAPARAVRFQLESAEVRDRDSVRLRYKTKMEGMYTK